MIAYVTPFDLQSSFDDHKLAFKFVKQKMIKKSLFIEKLLKKIITKKSYKKTF